jgi:transcriptional antiterminator NusG
MRLTEETWFAVRNTPGVTGFVGSDQPTPVSEKEMKEICSRMGAEEPKYDINFSEGEIISIIDGPFKGFEGAVSEIDPIKGKLKVMVSMFGRETSVELDALQVKKI